MANLAQTLHLLELQAGGPGSGRKPSIASNQALKIHSHLTDNQGYQYVNSTKTKSGYVHNYTDPEDGGSAKIFDSGKPVISVRYYDDKGKSL